MAATKNNEEIRKQALEIMTAGRTEIGTELQRLHLQLSPARILHRLVDRHTGLVVMIAAAAGFVPVLMFFPRKPSHPRVTLRVPIHGDTPPKPVTSALLVGAVGVLAKAVTPAMVKSVVVSPLLKFLARKQGNPSDCTPTQ